MLDPDEEEAKRRCLNAGYSLEMEARNLTSFPIDDRRPLWEAHYLREVLRERARAALVEAAAQSPASRFTLAMLFSPQVFAAAMFNCIFEGWL
jgi:hypothetical protein